MTIYKDI